LPLAAPFTLAPFRAWSLAVPVAAPAATTVRQHTFHTTATHVYCQTGTLILGPRPPAWATSLAPPRLRHCYRVVQVDVLDEVEEPHALRHRSLERLASRDEATASAALVQDSGTRGLGEVIVTRRAA